VSLSLYLKGRYIIYRLIELYLDLYIN
jgi:hypothetical protein